MQRSQGEASIRFKRRGPATVLDRLYQQGCAKIRLPRTYNLHCPEAVLLNTSGGLTGGDRFDVDAHWGEGTSAIVTTQAAERVYKASADTARVTNRLTVARGAQAYWLPQETILFEGGSVSRQFDVEMEAGSTLIAVESWMVGRTAMGEVVRHASVRDDWRVRLNGSLVFADCLKLEGDVQALLERPAIMRGDPCFATLLIVADDAAGIQDGLRVIMPCSDLGGVVAARLFAADAFDLRRRLDRAIKELSRIMKAPGLHVPTVWHS